MIETLQQHGEVKFLDKEEDKTKYNYISFIPEGSEKAIRLDGPMFKKNIDFNELRTEYNNNVAMEKNDSLRQLSNEERTSKVEKLNKHKEIQKGFNEKLKDSGVKKIKKNTGRKYLPKSKQLKNTKKFTAKNPQPKQQPKQPQPSDKEPDYVKINTEKSIKETKQSLKQQELFEKIDNKKQEASKPENPAKSPVEPSNNKKQGNPTSNDPKPATAPSNQSTGSKAAALTVQINQVLASKLSLELQIGGLSIYKERDIKKIFELKQKIAELEQQIATLKAEQEQAAESELIQQQANRYKNSGSMKLKMY